MKLELINEPLIEFGNDFLCDDPKMGITIGGFFSLSNQSHRSEIHYSVIGTKGNTELFIDWINNLKSPIESKSEIVINDTLSISDGEIKSFFDDEDNFHEILNENIQNKKLNPDFPGFNKESIFKSEFLNNTSNNISIKNSDIDEIIESKQKKLEKIDLICSIFEGAFVNLAENCINKPDICFIIIPEKIFDKLGSVPFGKQHINFRRKLKSLLISKNFEIPTQFILESTITGNKRQLQDMSMIAWNFVVAQYYKTKNCIPWALTDIDKDSCYIGISFHKILNSENNVLRSSVAQAFNRQGNGLVFIGKQFEWDQAKTKVSSPHLRYDYAKDLVQEILENYILINNHTPSRVVIHKTTDFWNVSDSELFCEAEGFKDGIKNKLGDHTEIDLVTIKSSDFKLLRSVGKYPVPRGLLCKMDESWGVLYSTGYIPYYETYPGVYIPQPLDIKIFEGESTLRNVCREILSLTKMNFNNCSYYDGLPITLRFAKKVGEIIQYLPDGSIPPNKYFYYM
ncbi:MAG: hypothetical protein A2068_11645 [Ignavibacteria bacterium GWB2_35_6b]|nr:MAG: hypothetical protein A2068_11645 [Ignavibacteria bacterium GWB2_35_6b]